MSRLVELTRKVDAFFARVEARHGTAMQCQTGCHDCCHAQLSITWVEAQAVAAHVVALPADQRSALAARARAAPDPLGRCAALDTAGRCAIYPARPLVCRSHGVPIRLSPGSLPTWQSCGRNFTEEAPDPDCILDQATLSTLLLIVDRAARAEDRPSSSQDREPSPGRDGDRIELAQWIAQIAAS